MNAITLVAFENKKNKYLYKKFRFIFYLYNKLSDNLFKEPVLNLYIRNMYPE